MRAVARPGPILRRANHRIFLDAEVVERQGPSRHTLGTQHRFRVAMEGRGIGREYQGPIRHGADLFDALLHVGAPQFEVAAVFGFPILIEVQQDVGSTLPGPIMGMDGEIGMDVEEAAPRRLVEASPFERGIGDKVVHAEELADELYEAGRIEFLEDALQRGSPRLGSVLLNLRSLTWR